MDFTECNFLDHHPENRVEGERSYCDIKRTKHTQASPATSGRCDKEDCLLIKIYNEIGGQIYHESPKR